jgi:hypothetical protein
MWSRVPEVLKLISAGSYDVLLSDLCFQIKARIVAEALFEEPISTQMSASCQRGLKSSLVGDVCCSASG